MRTSIPNAWLGVWLVILPFFGIPGVWKERLVLLTGLCLLAWAGTAYYRVLRVSEGAAETQAKGETPVSFPKEAREE